MGDLADDALERMMDYDEEQLTILGTSNVFSHPTIIVGKICATCGSPTIQRHGKYGLFLACSSWPLCRGPVGVMRDQELSEEDQHKMEGEI